MENAPKNHIFPINNHILVVYDLGQGLQIHEYDVKKSYSVESCTIMSLSLCQKHVGLSNFINLGLQMPPTKRSVSV
jgi:hypothetical protein